MAVGWNGQASENEPVLNNRLESPSKDEQTVAIEDAQCRIEFDRGNGGLRRITNRRLGDECLKGGASGTMPFRIYADISKVFDIAINSLFQIVFDDPATICKTTVQPENCRLIEVDQKDGLLLRYQGAGV